ncbi:MAG: uracil-DNA glycosylase [bacterium]|nr:uracil-DNA glycosylase [bacterium]
MSDKSADLRLLLQRAIKAQIDLGMDELILTPIKESAPPRPDVVADKWPTDETKAPEVMMETPPLTQFETLEDHRLAICDCQKCSLGASRNKFVYGVGNTQADLMFIGEAPGADEDRIGEPFVGRAGQLLDRILAAIELSRQEVYIANILKCRPPGNRDPQPDEMELCFGYLHEQVRLIKPKLICALGRIAAQALLKTTTPLGKLRSRWHEFSGVPTLVTYHPAALLRFASYKRDTWEDMKLLKARYESMK